MNSSILLTEMQLIFEDIKKISHLISFLSNLCGKFDRVQHRIFNHSKIATLYFSIDVTCKERNAQRMVAFKATTFNFALRKRARLQIYSFLG